jgi:hypothetical protein
MRTIKQSVFRELSNRFGDYEFTRKDIQKAVWNAQGFNADEFTYRQGYYGINIKSWHDDERLIERQSRGHYKLTEVGNEFATCSYEEGVALIRENNKNVLDRRKAKREANRKALPPHILHADKFQHLSGLTITRVRYMTPKEVEHLGWYNSSIVLEMSDGSLLFPQMDDEGNDGGAMAHISELGMATIYTI